ncbi:flagellar hook assembly protein FlgD [Jannaschia sp. S6380]|uniref:flagellar hook capping FlgD N-terminal domain-containing protein n=1 Tax=Jannaschia sp. S6380 TaxID=2926408 RepID=UPI001FF3E5FA|nr:flagellar hook capping FlgD N-terminal domain-containing protein [Jannaschia sp. S6380]MCK0168880.1 flagellar hook assembly protein FlgD [Jannaschia sp. S6380]
MDITSTATAPTASARPPASSGAASATSDFDMFLTLLTAQIRNQDPLQPADSTEYTAQLATFSNVEQSVQTNDLLGQMIARLDAQQVTGAAQYIGMEFRHSGPVGHTGGTTVLHTSVPPLADRAELVVLDDTGREVGRHDIDPNATTLGWPASGQGATVPDGHYTLRVDSWSGEQPLDPIAVSHYAAVTEVVLGDGGAEVILDGGVRLALASLESIRAAETG